MASDFKIDTVTEIADAVQSNMYIAEADGFSYAEADRTANMLRIFVQNSDGNASVREVRNELNRRFPGGSNASWEAIKYYL